MIVENVQHYHFHDLYSFQQNLIPRNLHYYKQLIPIIVILLFQEQPLRMDEQRQFINPCDDQNEHQVQQIQLFDYQQNNSNLTDIIDPDFQQTNTHHHMNLDLSQFVSAESQIVVTNARMLETIKEVAEELLASSVIPYQYGRGGEAKGGVLHSEIQAKARHKLGLLGLKQQQIDKLLMFQVKKLSPKKKQNSKEIKNLVYQAETAKKNKRNQHRHHTHK